MKFSLCSILVLWFIVILWLAAPTACADAVASSPAPGTSATKTAPVVVGRQLYSRYCEQCHQADGLGVAERFPPLVGSEWVTGPSRTVIRIILNGLEGPISIEGRHFDGVMPAGKNQLSDGEVAAIATFLRQWKSNQASPVSTSEVSELRRSSVGRDRPWTEPELRGSPPIWPWIAFGSLFAAFIASWIGRRAVRSFRGRPDAA